MESVTITRVIATCPKLINFYSYGSYLCLHARCCLHECSTLLSNGPFIHATALLSWSICVNDWSASLGVICYQSLPLFFLLASLYTLALVPHYFTTLSDSNHYLPSMILCKLKQVLIVAFALAAHKLPLLMITYPLYHWPSSVRADCCYYGLWIMLSP